MKLDIKGFGLALGARQKRVFAAATISVAVLGAAAIGYAGPTLHTFKDGDTLSAADLNGNFSALDTRLMALEEKTPTYLVAESNETETGVLYQDLVYQSLSLDLSPGTWLVEGVASLSTTVSPDQVQISLWDDTNAVEVPQSRSPLAATTGIGGATACDGTTTFCNAATASTKTLLKVEANTKIRLKGHRNGNSILWFGPSQPGIILPSVHRLTAQRIK